jgi:hypothetical protein
MTMNNRRPVKLLRLFMAVVFKVFYVTVLNYLLGPLNCSWLATAKVRRNVDFPDESEFPESMHTTSN